MALRPCLRRAKSSQYFRNPIQSHFSFQTQAQTLVPKIALRNLDNGDFYNSLHLFEESPQPDPSYYNSLLFASSRDNSFLKALNIFKLIHGKGFLNDGCSSSCVLKVCGCLCDDVVGKQVHCLCIKFGFMVDVSVGTSLVDMYMKTKNVGDAEHVFEEMEEKNVVSWTSLLAGYMGNRLVHRAIGVFSTLQANGIKPNPFTFATLLGGLADVGDLEKGVQMHATIVKSGSQSFTFVANSLINMYLKSGMVKEAEVVFTGIMSKSEVSWNGMIAGLVSNGHDLESIDLFHQMRLSGVNMTQSTFVTVTKLCSKLKDLTFARQLQCCVIRHGFDDDHNIKTALMVCYTKSKEMDDAVKLFYGMPGGQNVVTWTALISGYLQNNGKEQAVDLFRKMRIEGASPNEFTYSSILNAYPVISPCQIHVIVIKTNYECSPTVGTALLDAYVKIGNTCDAAKVFETINEKDIVAWSAMLSGYSKTEDNEGAVRLFCKLTREGIKPNEFTFSSVINACNTQTATAEQGKQFHACSIKFGYSNALCVSSALVTMYAKRGNIESANEVFKRKQESDLVSYNSMITGFAQHGYAKKALTLFDEMKRKNMEMDSITFVGVISACTHAGLVQEGQRYFDMMIKDLNIPPTLELYACMVDLYSRAGKLLEAMDLIHQMPFPPGETVWRTLLAACRVHRNLDLGEVAAEKLIALNPQDSSAYVLLSNLYAVTGNWKEREKVRNLMEDRKVKKETGYSWIEVKNKTYSFIAGDTSHPLSDLIYTKLDEMRIRLKDYGYQIDASCVLHDVEDEVKEVILFRHSERLALAFGLIVTSVGSPIQIVKNLRVCGDCHNVFKLVSKIEGREIVVRDSNRFHHFKDGVCSCKDYW